MLGGRACDGSAVGEIGVGGGKVFTAADDVHVATGDGPGCAEDGVADLGEAVDALQYMRFFDHRVPGQRRMREGDGTGEDVRRTRCDGYVAAKR